MESTWNALTQGAENEEAVREASRDLHTLKGDARIVGFEEVHVLSHKLEELFALAGQLQYRVSEVFELVVTMATQFVGMLLRKKTGGATGIDLAGFIRQVDEVLRETRVLRRSKPTGPRTNAPSRVSHVFQKKPEAVNQCMACHGSRVGDEYTGDRGLGDVHLSQQGMDCIACHPAGEMHASGEGLTSRYQLPQLPKCTGCHAPEQLGKVAQHKDHAGKLQCQGCHSQDYVNCYSCHTAKDDDKVAYFVNPLEVESFKIGLNYPGTVLDEKYIVVRHEPTDKEVFAFYGKDGFKTFDSVPTWKRA